MEIKKRGSKPKIIGAFIIILLVTVLIHTYYIIYGFSIPEISNSITGQATFEDVINKVKNVTQKTKIIIAAEWLIVIYTLIYVLIKTKKRIEKDKLLESSIGKIEIKAIHTSRSKTDIDVLYDLLKQKKILTITAVSIYFKVEKNLAMEWFRILEEGNLATINYPTIGEARISLNEPEVKLNESKKEK